MLCQESWNNSQDGAGGGQETLLKLSEDGGEILNLLKFIVRLLDPSCLNPTNLLHTLGTISIRCISCPSSWLSPATKFTPCWHHQGFLKFQESCACVHLTFPNLSGSMPSEKPAVYNILLHDLIQHCLPGSMLWEAGYLQSQSHPRTHYELLLHLPSEHSAVLAAGPRFLSETRPSFLP